MMVGPLACDGNLNSKKIVNIRTNFGIPGIQKPEALGGCNAAVNDKLEVKWKSNSSYQPEITILLTRTIEERIVNY
jgi:hypothetical protein